MIRHIVLFRLKDARPDKVEAAAQMLRSMRGKIEGLLDLEVGLDFLASERSYHLALLCTFDNEEHFAAYADHRCTVRSRPTCTPCGRRASPATTASDPPLPRKRRNGHGQ